MSEGMIRVGIGGWSYAPWRGTFFPSKLPQSRELEFASRSFGAIEINATFYGRQSVKSWQSWAATAPEGCQFAVKGSRFCVTRTRLAEAGEGIAAFMDQGLVALGPKLGPILWMFAARRTFDREDLARFIDLLPEQFDGAPLRHVIEPRHESFRDEAFFALCRDRNIAVAFDDNDEFPCIDEATADFAYARLQRMREEVETGYEEPALDAFAERARRWQADGRDAYIFMINGAKVRAPAAAMALQQRLGIAPA
jgi:uncharacterized protein YecE (DUF72 family)